MGPGLDRDPTIDATDSGGASDFERSPIHRDAIPARRVILAQGRRFTGIFSGVFMSRSVPFGAALPKGWPKRVRSAVIHAMSMAHATLTTSRGWAANHWNARFRLKVENDRLRQEVALLDEEIRIKDSRMPRIPAHERLAILELRAIRGWSLTQTADRLLVKTATVSSWMQRINERGPAAIVQVPVPVNKFPEFVAYIVQRLKVLCPSLGYVKIAQLLCRAGLHLGTTTVRRMLRDDVSPKDGRESRKAVGKRIVARHPNHVWGCDLTTVPISFGFWTSSFPFAWPQRWPFCWWIAIVVDHFSRRIMGIAIFPKQPTAEAVRTFLARVIRKARARPKHLITDQGRQFRDRAFRTWCKRMRIHQRFGAIRQFGSIAIIERLIQTVKNGCTRRLLVPYTNAAMRHELTLFSTWYNQERPHEWLAGATPDEAYGRLVSACARPRLEPRRKWPTRSPCAAPLARIDGRRGAELDLHVSYRGGRRHLPIVSLERVA
jgi:transposase InsO family protein